MNLLDSDSACKKKQDKQLDSHVVCNNATRAVTIIQRLREVGQVKWC